MSDTIMSQLPEIIVIEPRDEAERLWRGAGEALAESSRSFVRLCESLELGLRSVEILAILKLAEVSTRFPATIAMLFEAPDPKVDVERDALGEPHALSFLHLLDLTSADGLDCVARKLHRGWEDRRRSCARARAVAREALGFELEAADRDQLLRLEAYRNRIFRVPPPVEIRPAEIQQAFPVLERMYEKLARP